MTRGLPIGRPVRVPFLPCTVQPGPCAFTDSDALLFRDGGEDSEITYRGSGVLGSRSAKIVRRTASARVVQLATTAPVNGNLQFQIGR